MNEWPERLCSTDKIARKSREKEKQRLERQIVSLDPQPKTATGFTMNPNKIAATPTRYHGRCHLQHAPLTENREDCDR